MTELDARLAALPANADAETIQTEIYAVGKAHFEKFARLVSGVSILLGQDQGRVLVLSLRYGLAGIRADCPYTAEPD